MNSNQSNQTSNHLNSNQNINQTSNVGINNIGYENQQSNQQSNQQTIQNLNLQTQFDDKSLKRMKQQEYAQDLEYQMKIQEMKKQLEIQQKHQTINQNHILSGLQTDEKTLKRMKQQEYAQDLEYQMKISQMKKQLDTIPENGSNRALPGATTNAVSMNNVGIADDRTTKRMKQQEYAAQLLSQQLITQQQSIPINNNNHINSIQTSQRQSNIPLTEEYVMGPLGLPIRKTLEVGNRKLQKEFNQRALSPPKPVSSLSLLAQQSQQYQLQFQSQQPSQQPSQQSLQQMNMNSYLSPRSPPQQSLMGYQSQSQYYQPQPPQLQLPSQGYIPSSYSPQPQLQPQNPIYLNNQHLQQQQFQQQQQQQYEDEYNRYPQSNPIGYPPAIIHNNPNLNPNELFPPYPAVSNANNVHTQGLGSISLPDTQEERNLRAKQMKVSYYFSI